MAKKQKQTKRSIFYFEVTIAYPRDAPFIRATDGYELDRIVGNERRVFLADRQKLPYTNAVVHVRIWLTLFRSFTGCSKKTAIKEQKLSEKTLLLIRLKNGVFCVRDSRTSNLLGPEARCLVPEVRTGDRK